MKKKKKQQQKREKTTTKRQKEQPINRVKLTRAVNCQGHTFTQAYLPPLTAARRFESSRTANDYSIARRLSSNIFTLCK